MEKIYPNPGNDQIAIDFGTNINLLSGYTLRIDNSLSQTMYTTPVTQLSQYVDLNSWTGYGVYFVYLIDGLGHVKDVRKIVIQ